MSFYRGRGRGRGPQRPQRDKHRINRFIRVPNVRLIDEIGTQVGVVETQDALRRAEEAGLDLVEVSPNSDPPVCKILDYGKFKYKEQKKLNEAKKHRSETTVKELRVRYRTDSGDLEIKLNRARSFLEEGDKVKFSMRFRGREAMYLDLGLEKFDEIAKRLEDVAEVEERSPRRGNFIYIVFSPLKTAVAKPPAKGEAKDRSPESLPGDSQEKSPESPSASE